jgi:hypothetical protein
MLQEVAARSGYQQQIAVDLAEHGDHFRELGRHLNSVALGTTDALVAFVDEVESDIKDRLSESDDQKVLTDLHTSHLLATYWPPSGHLLTTF